MSTGYDEETKKDAAQLVYSRAPMVPQPHPWLVVFHGMDIQMQSFYSISERRYHYRIIPELRNQTILCASRDGWLVLGDLASPQCSLFNLVSKETIQLPTVKKLNRDYSKYYIHCLVLGRPSNPESCQVVFLSNARESSTLFVYYCKPGDTEFRSEEFCIDDDKVVSAIVFKGKVYVLTDNHSYLFVIDFSNQSRPKFTPLLHKSFEKEKRERLAYLHGYQSSWLIESCEGELFFVNKMSAGMSICREAIGFLIFKLDSSEESWIEVKSIGKKRTIFLDEDRGMMVPTTEEFKGNTIYFTQCEDRCLYVFDLENNMFSLNLPFPGRLPPNPVYNWINIPADRVD